MNHLSPYSRLAENCLLIVLLTAVWINVARWFQPATFAARDVLLLLALASLVSIGIVWITNKK